MTCNVTQANRLKSNQWGVIMSITKNEAKGKIEAIVSISAFILLTTQSSKPFTDYINFVSKQYDYGLFEKSLDTCICFCPYYRKR